MRRGTSKIIICAITCILLAAAALAFNIKRNEQLKKHAELLRQGSDYFARAEVDSAISALQEAVTLKKNDDTSRRLLGKAYEIKGDLAKAADHYRASLSINPRQPETLYHLAIIHKSQGQTDEAISKLTEALAVNPDFVAARIILGDMYAQAGHTAMAKEQYQTILELKPFGTDLEQIRRKMEALR